MRFPKCYFQDYQHVCQCVAINPVDIESYLATIIS